MPVSRVHGRIVLTAQIDLVVGKEIVAGDEVVGVGKAGGLGVSATQVAGAADGHDLARLPRTFAAQPSGLGFGGVVGREIAVAGKTIKREGSERVGRWINTRSVASGALGGEDVRLPGFAVVGEDGKLAVADQLEGAVVLRAADYVCRVFGELRDVRRHADGADGPGMRLLLPGGTDHTAMAEQALVAGHVIGHRLADVVIAG